MFQLGQKFVSKANPKIVWTVVEVKPEQKAYVGQASDRSVQIFAESQMVNVTHASGQRLGSF